MTRWRTDPEAAAGALIAGSIETFDQPLLWVGTERPATAPRGDDWHRRFSGSGYGTPEPPPGPYATVVLRLPKSRAEQAMTTHLCLGVLTSSGSLIVYGGNDEGIRSYQKTLSELAPVTVLASRGHGRILRVQRTEVVGPIKARIHEWRQTHALNGQARVSYPGLFADGVLDPGTALLLEHLPPLPPAMTVLDYGAGPGAISAHIASAQSSAHLTLLDSDSVALLAASQNVPGAALVGGDGLAAVAGRTYDLIVSNPPLHTGFRDDTGPLLRLIAEAPAHLAARGRLIMVVLRQVGIDDALAAAFTDVQVLADDGRYKVWSAGGRRR